MYVQSNFVHMYMKNVHVYFGLDDMNIFPCLLPWHQQLTCMLKSKWKQDTLLFSESLSNLQIDV